MGGGLSLSWSGRSEDPIVCVRVCNVSSHMIACRPAIRVGRWGRFEQSLHEVFTSSNDM